ncbi:heterokaryon incompatibility protein-domain-containing protein [Fusarium tricinctum]|uniref:Heterokaryon incompatibility protein-domain-containing protein n=1 Tax=Fusarium tricinctum TaxID=61284 RepID=A0A8K0RUD5_9HYPO|nr:heterokaryon incompatibility protein-domain-containing protein [Fusarium tricinctum]
MIMNEEKEKSGTGLSDGFQAPRLYPSCRSCLDLDLKTVKCAVDKDEEGYSHIEGDQMYSMKQPARHFRDARDAGCTICALLWGVLVFFNPKYRRDIIDAGVTLRFPTNEETGSLEICFRGAPSRDSCIQLFTTSSTLWNLLRPLPPIHADRSPTAVGSFVKRAIKDCLDNHPTCATNQNDRLPTRLLNVAKDLKTVVQLVHTNDFKSAPYAALSYCWGDSAILKTTRSSMKSMEQGIEMASLPAAYVDAVRLCREIGISYLWIDALCIIQDDPDDWQREAATMGNVYSNAYLTIAAESTASATQSFLGCYENQIGGADAHIYPEFTKVVYFGDGAKPVTVKARVVHELGIHWRWIDDTRERFPKEPLSRRGWCLQERLLSTRLLSFSLHEMQWICQTTTSCECQSSLNRYKQFGTTPLYQLPAGHVAFRFWLKTVENYSQRSLTRISDKLPAISGVADIIQRITGSDYLAGLWLNDIYLGLLWRRAPGRLPHMNTVAPSFSWASINGEVDYSCFRNGKRPFHPACSVQPCNTKATSMSTLDRVDAKELIIQGPLVEGMLQPSHGDKDHYVFLGGQQFSLTADTHLADLRVTGLDGKLVNTVCRRRPHDSQDASHPRSVQSNLGGPGQMLSSEARCWALRVGCFLFEGARPFNLHEILVLGRSKG